MTKLLDWEALYGQQVRIYKNLTNNTLSVQSHVKGKGWRLAGHVTDIVLQDVTFHISEAARQRVISQHSKNVHAYCKGRLIADSYSGHRKLTRITYNPYKTGAFVEVGSQLVAASCTFLVVKNNQVFTAESLV